MAGKGDSDFSYELVEELGVLSTSKKGWTKEINRVSYNGMKPKFDLREWAPEHEKMSKGITLSEEEARDLCKILFQYFKNRG
ncbi:YdbC family protein [Acidaminococcus timonensis]|uniref:YdbC family protein n=1 Tax=Acidaminococcus timonensis TaxID=1871002 RepID=UPI0008DA404A|nr:PC4/YdbC family ssDNA-binding protein [Acidaminococcus timonensis]